MITLAFSRRNIYFFREKNCLIPYLGAVEGLFVVIYIEYYCFSRSTYRYKGVQCTYLVLPIGMFCHAFCNQTIHIVCHMMGMKHRFVLSVKQPSTIVPRPQCND